MGSPPRIGRLTSPTVAAWTALQSQISARVSTPALSYVLARFG